MAHKIIWSPRSVANLEDIFNYIAKDSTQYATFFANKIFGIVANLPQFPLSGRIVPEYRDENLREKIYENYRIVYRLKSDFIEIVTICHSAQILR